MYFVWIYDDALSSHFKIHNQALRTAEKTQTAGEEYAEQKVMRVKDD